jgi:wyosine [tRNA(Phe)-imidazoG37] synthetase (radical SAM superfamily)
MEERGAITPRHFLGLEAGHEKTVSSVYGPVFSWRHGESLGADLLLHQSTCSFHCVYCQLGEIRLETRNRNVYVPTRQFMRDLRASDWQRADVITFAGSGEPTLAANLGEAIREAKAETSKQVVVLTNASMLAVEEVRDDLLAADHISCKLDAPTEELFGRINRPLGGLSLEDLVAGICLLRDEFDGCLSVQTMVLPNNEHEATKFVELLERIAPDEVHLNLPSRPRPQEWHVEARGAHRTFAGERAFRMVSRDEVLKLAGDIHVRTRIRVLTPPQTTETAVPPPHSTVRS